MAICSERKLRVIYRDAQQIQTTREICPIVLVYHLECVLLVGWCELRRAFRHFRTDRIYGCQVLETGFKGKGVVLRDLWTEQCE